MSSLTLFQPSSPATDSVVFELNQQKTVVAMGMQPGDWIGFEIVRISDAARSKVCGCRLLEAGISVVYQLQALMCPACSDGSPRFVRVTPENPIVVLDAPQGALLRAVYHGTGIDLGTVTVTVGDSDTIDLTSTLRGCPPVYCEDEPETWTPTGLHRCTSTNVEIEEISNCGNKRWVECGPTVWTDTGNRRCLAGSYSMQEQNQCGAIRWTIIEAEAWIDTGLTTCYDNAGVLSIRAEQTNQCGARRWENRGPATWIATGNTRCTASAFEQEERSEPCGTLRWVFQAALAWAPTGTYDCRSGINWRQEANQCGDIRWVNTGEACGTSVHTMASLTRVANSVIEGQQACWNFTLNAPVVGAPLTVSFDLAGADHVRNNYSTPRSVVLPVGASGGQLCITTTDDLVIDGTEQLCVTPVLSARLTNAPGMSCISVLDNDIAGEDPYDIDSITQSTADPITEGQQVCWQFTLSRAVENAPLSIGVVWGGADDARNNYPNSTLVIPVGQSVGTLCLNTIDDADVDGTEQLCMASISVNSRLGTIPVLPCVDVLDNDTLDPGDSSHAILSIVPVLSPITEGQQGCWLVTLDAPVTNTNLVINFGLSGADQTRHGYLLPSLIIPVGDSSGTVCVTTTDDVVVEGMEQLCITALTSGRITAVPAASCINVNDNDVAASIHTISCVTPPEPATEGDLVCWAFELDAPVAVAPLTVTGTLSGTEQAIHGYTNPSVIVPVGESTGELCVQTIDDVLVEGTKTLCLTFATSARLTAITDEPCEGPSALAPLAFDGETYTASVSDSHNVAARVELFIRADGTWEIEQGASPGGGFFNGAPLTGEWHTAPSVGIGSGYEVRFTVEGTIFNNYDGDLSEATLLSPDTGWLPLSTDRSTQVFTGHMTDGNSSDGGMIEVTAGHTVEIRPIGGGATVTATLNMSADGMSAL